jgi:hypothetical protein
VERGQPALPLVLGDGPGLHGDGRQPLGHLGGEAGRVALDRGEGMHADGRQPGLGQQRR